METRKTPPLPASADNQPAPQSAAGHWDAFWRARGQAAVFDQTGLSNPTFDEFWRQFFTRELRSGARTRLIDVGCGNGPVTAMAFGVADAKGERLDACCIDCSAAALAEVRKRFPAVKAAAHDVCNIPFAERSFDVVVSQFGIEYGGAAAFAEAARLVADGGVLTAVVHIADSALHRECVENLATVRALSGCGLLPSARAVFSTGLGPGEEGTDFATACQIRGARLGTALEDARKILRLSHGHAIGKFAGDLCDNIEYMHRRAQNYALGQVLAWLDVMARELTAYEGRMASMVACALDDAAMARIVTTLSQAGLVVERPTVLAMQGSREPAGWVLSARRAITAT